jgi:hypothetical protein
VQPYDVHNRFLVSNVHPPDWASPEPAGRYNLVVLGAGTAGLISAIGAAGLGARVALVERGFLGGDCLNVGCVPSKALIRASRAAAEVRDAGDYGVDVPAGARVNFPAAMERMRRLRAALSPNDSAARYRSLGVDVFFGQARFTGSDTVEVGGRALRFRRAVIATGARAARPEIPGLAEAGYLTNETIFTLTELPPRLAIIGAGPVGCELAQAFARFGARVTLLGTARRSCRARTPTRPASSRTRCSAMGSTWSSAATSSTSSARGPRRCCIWSARGIQGKGGPMPSLSAPAGRPMCRDSTWRRPGWPTTRKRGSM